MRACVRACVCVCNREISDWAERMVWGERAVRGERAMKCKWRHAQSTRVAMGTGLRFYELHRTEEMKFLIFFYGETVACVGSLD